MKKNNLKTIWESPVYRFRIPSEKNPSKVQEIIVDVTGSAPTFEEPLDTMKMVFQELLRSSEGKKAKTVLDFGAAKFRNTLYFLTKGKKVDAVEFEELLKKSKQARDILKKCKKKTNFQKLIFPYPFLNNSKKFDLVLLINVLPVMPVFAERLLVLQLLHNKVSNNGHVLWYAQQEGSYKKTRESKEQTLGDGIWIGATHKYKTFFKYHTREEINELMGLSGFEFVKKYTAPGNDVMLYRKTKYNLFEKIVSLKMIRDSIPYDKTIKDPKIKPKLIKKKTKMKIVIPDPENLSIYNLYYEALEKIKKGKTDAEAFHRLASQIIARVFSGSLRNMEIKQDMNGGRKIIDTVYRNGSDSGFFKDLSSNFDIKCPYIVMEAKNYSFDPKNPEFDQLAGRLTDKIGKFGILVCRTIKNKKAVKDKCKGFLDDGRKHIVVLDDNDLIELLSLKDADDWEGIDDFMHEKIKHLIF